MWEPNIADFTGALEQYLTAARKNLSVILTTITVIVSGGVSYITGYYIGYFALFGFEAMQFFSIADLKSDAFTEILKYSPVFLITFFALTLIYGLLFRKHTPRRIFNLGLFSFFCCLVVKMVSVFPADLPLLATAIELLQYSIRFGSKQIIWSAAVLACVALAVVIFRRIHGVGGIILRYIAVYCFYLIIIIGLGYMKALRLASSWKAGRGRNTPSPGWISSRLASGLASG